MSSSLVNGITDLFKSQALGPLAARSGESENSILKGFETTVVAMVTGLASKLGQSGSSRQIMDLINSPANDANVLDNVRGLVEHQPADGIGSKLTSLLFGGSLSSVTDAIGNVAGLRGGTAASLMSMGAPLLLGSLVQRVRNSHLDSAGLARFVTEEASGVQGMLPAGLKTILGGAAPSVTAVPPIASAVIPEKEKSGGWLWPLLIGVLAVLGLLWWFTSRRPNTEPVQTATNAVQSAASTAANTVGDLITRALPGGIDLHIPAGRMEDHLLTFIQDSSKTVDNTTWFDFDRLLFDTGSATLQPSSDEQLRNVAGILKAYPNVHAKIGGYTDNTGDAAANQKLSQQRADTVKQQLTGMGISADRMEAQGYGDQHPVADNSTDEGRQQNRRISLLVTQK